MKSEEVKIGKYFRACRFLAKVNSFDTILCLVHFSNIRIKGMTKIFFQRKIDLYAQFFVHSLCYTVYVRRENYVNER